MDTTRADHFGFMGNRVVKTPRLDAIAAESIVLTNCMTDVPTTLPSHVSLFTGKYSHHHGTPWNGYMVNRDNVMLAEILKEAGFTTAGFAGSFALDSRFDIAQGFDTYDQTFNESAGDARTDGNQRRAEKITDAVVDYLDEQGVPDRLFLFVHYFDPHFPYDAPVPFHGMYRSNSGKEHPPTVSIDIHQDLEDDPASQEHGRLMIAEYAAEITYMDFHIGRLFDELRRRGILDEAILLVTSDHGDNFMEHLRFFNHSKSVYQTTIHSIGVIRLPRAEAGGTEIEEPVANIDLLPTLLRVLEISPPPEIDGEAIPLKEADGALAQRTRFGQATLPKNRHETDPRWLNLLKARYIRSGNLKFIQTPYRKTEELYDLESDPGEQRNLLENPSQETLEIAARLRAELTAWAESADPLPSQFEQAQQDDTRERLKSLGYIQDP